MTVAYDAGIIDRVMPRVKQYEATTGRKISPQMLESLMKAELDVEAGHAEKSKALELQESQFNQNLALQKEQMDKAEKAAMVGGIVDIGKTAGIGTLLWKGGYFGKTPAVPAITPNAGVAYSSVGPGGVPMRPEAMPAYLSGAPAVGTAPATAGAPWTTGGVSGIDYAASAAPGAQAQVTGVPAFTSAAPTAAAVETTPATFSAATGASLLSGAGLVYAGQKIGPPLLEKAGMSKPYAEAVSAGGAVGAIGTAAGKGAESITGSSTAGDVVRWIADPVGSTVEFFSGLW